jgi:uroporphyrinogen-III synthase
MATVLLTRPEVASHRLAQTVALLGYRAIIEPMLSIQAFPSGAPDLQAVQAVAVTSSNAIDVLGTIFFDKTILTLPCFCVGMNTAAAAHEFGFTDVRCADGNGYDLARLIIQSLSNTSGPILHIAGRDVESHMGNELSAHGYKVELWEIYAAHTIQKMSSETATLWRHNAIDIVMVYSLRTAQALVALVTAEGLQSACASMTAIAISDRVADGLRNLPWRRMIVASKPSDNAMIDCLQLLPGMRHD